MPLKSRYFPLCAVLVALPCLGLGCHSAVGPVSAGAVGHPPYALAFPTTEGTNISSFGVGFYIAPNGDPPPAFVDFASAVQVLGPDGKPAKMTSTTFAPGDAGNPGGGTWTLWFTPTGPLGWYTLLIPKIDRLGEDESTGQQMDLHDAGPYYYASYYIGGHSPGMEGVDLKQASDGTADLHVSWSEPVVPSGTAASMLSILDAQHKALSCTTGSNSLASPLDPVANVHYPTLQLSCDASAADVAYVRLNEAPVGTSGGANVYPPLGQDIALDPLRGPAGAFGDPGFHQAWHPDRNPPGPSAESYLPPPASDGGLSQGGTAPPGCATVTGGGTWPAFLLLALLGARRFRLSNQRGDR